MESSGGAANELLARRGRARQRRQMPSHRQGHNAFCWRERQKVYDTLQRREVTRYGKRRGGVAMVLLAE